MIETLTYNQSQLQAYNYDPTRTLTLRNAFAREMRVRFSELTRMIRVAIVEEDCFGMKTETPSAPTMLQMTPPGQGAFAFPRSKDKVESFMRWLNAQVERGIIQTGTIQQIGTAVEGPWTNTYIFDSYKRGVQRARYELGKAGFDVPSIEQTGGINISMSTPFHLDRVGLLYSRAFEGLKGITTAMDTQISRVLAQGMVDGDNPRLLARKLIATINGSGMGDLAIKDSLGRFIPAQRRAEMLARTEIIRAHHQATIQEYENWAVEGVVVKAEWMSVGDDGRTCATCLSYTGQVFTLKQIRSLIPLHAQCRCIALPHKEKGAKKPVREVPYDENKKVMNKIIRKEKSIKNYAVEHGVTFDKRGNIISEIVGDGHSVRFSEADILRMKDAIFTHNHPSGVMYKVGDIRRAGRSFSMEDIRLAAEANVAEIRAVTPQYTFRLKRPARGWSSDRLITNAHKASTQYIKAQMNIALRRNGFVDTKVANTIHSHLVMKKFVKIMKWEYTKTYIK